MELCETITDQNTHGGYEFNSRLYETNWHTCLHLSVCLSVWHSVWTWQVLAGCVVGVLCAGYICCITRRGRCLLGVSSVLFSVSFGSCSYIVSARHCFQSSFHGKYFITEHNPCLQTMFGLMFTVKETGGKFRRQCATTSRFTCQLADIHR